jgi:hypothetical protein
MSDTYPNKPFEHFYHGEQTYNYILQFMAIFSGIQTSVGKSDLNPDGGLIYVPIRYGSTDKTVEWILSSQTSVKPIRVPVMAAKVRSVEFDPELRKGMRTSTRDVSLPRGGSMPDDLRVVRQMQPNPCRLGLELAVFTSNTKNRFEVLEQLLMLFDPDINFYISDDYHDHYKIQRVELMNMSLDEDYPQGQSSSMMIDTYQFNIFAAYRAPANVKDDYIKSIRLRLDAVSSLPVEEAVVELNSYGTPGETLFDIDDYDIPEN